MILIPLVVFRSILTSKSAFSTFKHHFRGGQNRFSTSGAHLRARNLNFWTSKTRRWSSKTRIWSSKTRIWTSKTHIQAVSGGGFAPPQPPLAPLVTQIEHVLEMFPWSVDMERMQHRRCRIVDILHFLIMFDTCSCISTTFDIEIGFPDLQTST